MTQEYLTLNKISSYKKAFALSNVVWDIVTLWEVFARQTVGSQFARASVYESLDWLEKSKRRNLIEKKDYEYIFKSLKELPKDINTLIKYTNDHLSD